MVTKSTFINNLGRTGSLWLGLVVILNGCLPPPATPPNRTTPPAQLVSTHLTLGNSSDASTANPDNYLLVKPQFALSYNRSRGTANWVSWHLDKSWRGDAPRTSSFRPDPDLPGTFPLIKTSDYTQSGFDRGHLCPSEDRDSSPADNAATFVLSNVMPQAPALNRGVWKSLEDYARKRVEDGNEVYLVAGGSGTGGEGENGSANSLANGKINVPAFFWKVLLVLPVGDNDLQRVGPNTEVVAVLMPNQQSATGRWQSYRVSINELESRTGLRFLGTLPADVQAALKGQTGGRY